MNYYQHRFSRIEDYLHHRPPYLLVDRVISLASKQIETEKRISGEEFFLAGHFPGAPVFPGAMMQELSTQSAGILLAANYNPMENYNTSDPDFNEFALGVLVRVKRAKYLGFARPGDSLRTKVILKDFLNELFDFSATIHVGDRLIMRNQFQLTNIASDVLRNSEA